MNKEKQTASIHPKYPLLIRCNECGEYKGVIYSAAIKPKKHRRSSDTNYPIIITCLCEGIRCEECGITNHRPISNYYVEEKDSTIHVPYFGGMFCRNCVNKGGKNE